MSVDEAVAIGFVELPDDVGRIYEGDFHAERAGISPRPAPSVDIETGSKPGYRLFPFATWVA